MHFADFGRALLREIDAKVGTVDEVIVSGAIADWNGYQKAVARRAAFLEMRELIVHALGRDEARL